MSFFTVNKEEAGSFDLLPEGTYEVYITEFKYDTFSTGSSGFKAVYTVRTDVEQVGGKQKLFDNYTYSEKSMFKFHQLAAALDYESGKSFATKEEFQQVVLNQAIRVKVKHEDYRGETQAKVSAVLRSQFGGQADTSPSFGKPLDITEDDLPF